MLSGPHMLSLQSQPLTIVPQSHAGDPGIEICDTVSILPRAQLLPAAACLALSSLGPHWRSPQVHRLHSASLAASPHQQSASQPCAQVKYVLSFAGSANTCAQLARGVSYCQPFRKEAGPAIAPLNGARGRFLPVDALQSRKDWGQLFPGMLRSKLLQGAPGFFSAGWEMCLPLYPDFCCC